MWNLFTFDPYGRYNDAADGDGQPVHPRAHAHRLMAEGGVSPVPDVCHCSIATGRKTSAQSAQEVST